MFYLASLACSAIHIYDDDSMLNGSTLAISLPVIVNVKWPTLYTKLTETEYVWGYVFICCVLFCFFFSSKWRQHYKCRFIIRPLNINYVLDVPIKTEITKQYQYIRMLSKEAQDY